MKEIDNYLTKLSEVQIIENEYQKALVKCEKVIKLTEEKKDSIPMGIIKTIVPMLIGLFISYLLFLFKSKRDVYIEEKLKVILTQVIGDRIMGSMITVREFKTKDPNAFCVAGRALFYTSGLKDILNEREVIAVMLHEYRHFKSFDIYTRIVTTGGIAWLIGKAFPDRVPRNLVIPISALLFFTVILTAGIPYKLVLGRLAEYKADSFPAKYGYAQDLISALKKLVGYYKVSKKHETSLFSIIAMIDNLIIDAHPSLAKRIQNIIKTEEIYKGSAISRVKAVKDAVKGNL